MNPIFWRILWFVIVALWTLITNSCTAVVSHEVGSSGEGIRLFHQLRNEKAATGCQCGPNCKCRKPVGSPTGATE